MDDETEVIKQQMAETRESLAEKLDTLENKVIGSVQGATDTVASTVESVSDTVAAVKETVHGTVESVKGTVRDTVESVREAFDISRQVERHPWPMFLGSVAVGFIGGYLLTPPRRDPRDERWPDMGRHAAWWPSMAHGDGLPPPAESRPGESHAETPGWRDKVSDQFQPALARLKELAIGAGINLVGEMLLSNAPGHMRHDIAGVIDQFTSALGGTVMEHPEASAQPEEPSRPQREEQSGPRNRLAGARTKGNGRRTA